MPLNMSEGEFRRSKWNTGRVNRGTTLPAQPRKAETTTEVRIVGTKRLILPMPPTLNHRLMPANGRLIKSPEARTYAEAVAWQAKQVFHEPVTCRVEVSVIMHPARGEGQDVDNCVKGVLDALTGVAWNDDSQVWRLLIERGTIVAGGQLDVTIREWTGS